MNKINSFIITLLLLCLSNTSYSQEKIKRQYTFNKGSEIGLSIGYMPSDNIIINLFNGLNYINYNSNYDYYPNLTLDDCFSESETMHVGDVYATGAINFTYTYRIKKWFEISGTINYSGVSINTHNNIDNLISTKLFYHTINLIPEARFVWFNSKNVKLYSSVGIGILSVTEKEYGEKTLSNFSIAGKFIPIGIKAGGKKVFGFAEFGFGSTGSATIGIGYNFD